MLSELFGHGAWRRQARWILAGGALGAILAGALVWNDAADCDCVSRAYLRITQLQVPASVLAPELITTDDMAATTQAALSRASVTIMVNSLGLYLDERRREPMEQVIGRFRKALTVSNDKGLVAVAFRYPDPQLAQRTATRVVSRLMEESTRIRTLRVLHTELFVGEQVTVAARDLDAAIAALRTAATKGAGVERAQLDLAQAQRHYQSLREKMAEAALRRRLHERREGSQLELIDPPTLPAASLARLFAPWSIAVGACVGFLGGSLLGALTACFLARVPRRQIARAY